MMPTSSKPVVSESYVPTSSPRPPKKPLGSTYQQTITVENIKALIEKYGYTYQDTITVEQDGGISVDFIKAYDGNGYIVYINLNGFGGSLLLTADHLSEQNRLKATAKTRIDASIRNAAAASKRDSVIIKGPEVCTIIHKDDGDCVQNFFTCIDNKKDSNIENGIEDTIPIQYPIISYFEIVQNLSGVMKQSKEFYDDQMKRIFDNTQKELDKIIKDTEYLAFAIKSFNDNRDLAFKALQNDRDKIASNFKSLSMTDRDDPAKKLQARHACNMYERNELFEEYIKTTHKFNKYTSIINGLTPEIVKLNNIMVEKHGDYHNQDKCSSVGKKFE
jgi:hypothetical protein